MPETLQTILSAATAGVLSILVVGIWNLISGWVKERLVRLVPLLGPLLIGVIVALVSGLIVMNWNAISHLEDTVASNTDRVTTSSVPNGAVMTFDRKTCPPHWTEYEPAYGRFIRGIDRSGRGIDPDGMRAPGSIQNEDFLAHSHTRPRGVYNAMGGPDASWVAHARFLGYGHAKPPATGKSGGIETRPDNVALLYCEKE